MATINHERKELVDTWCVDDVQSVRADLTDEQAFEVLCRVAHNFDANYGVNWDTLKITADDLYSIYVCEHCLESHINEFSLTCETCDFKRESEGLMLEGEVA